MGVAQSFLVLGSSEGEEVLSEEEVVVADVEEEEDDVESSRRVDASRGRFVASSVRPI